MSEDPLDQGLVYEDEMPLEWERVDELPSPQRLAGINAANEGLIRTREGLEESNRGFDDSAEFAQELQRIESKINLILELFAEWLRRQGETPPVRPVRLNAHGMAWESSDPVPVGELVRVACYICPSFPKPLVLHGRVLSQTAPGADGGLAVIEFVGASKGVSEGLERMVFRRHRREVAQLRGQRRGETDDE
jgi:hypothetical protein